MAVGGPAPRLVNAAINRQVREYLPSWPIAILAGGLILAVSVIGIALLAQQVSTFAVTKEAFLVSLGGDLRGAEGAVATASLGSVALSLLHLGLSVLALLTFAAWLAVATLNIPALGGGMPARGPVRVFVYTLVPLWNLAKVPGMVHDVLYRLDSEAGGFFLVLAAWIGLIGSRLVSWLGGWAITFAAVRDLIGAASIDEAPVIFGAMLDQTLALGIVVEVMAAVGAVLLVVLMVRIERRCALRNREIRLATGT